MSDDPAWLSALRRGDRDAQRICYEQHAPRLLAVIHALVQDEDAARDLLHDSFIKAFSEIASFRGESQFATWLHRLAVNEALQYLRRRKRMPILVSQVADAPAPAENDPVGGVDAIQTAMATMTPEHRLILLLKYRDGLDYAQISSQLDIAPGTVASRLNRARAELKELLNHARRMEETASATHPNGQMNPRPVMVPANPGVEGMR